MVGSGWPSPVAVRESGVPPEQASGPVGSAGPRQEAAGEALVPPSDPGCDAGIGAGRGGQVGGTEAMVEIAPPLGRCEVEVAGVVEAFGEREEERVIVELDEPFEPVGVAGGAGPQASCDGGRAVAGLAFGLVRGRAEAGPVGVEQQGGEEEVGITAARVVEQDEHGPAGVQEVGVVGIIEAGGPAFQHGTEQAGDSRGVTVKAGRAGGALEPLRHGLAAVLLRVVAQRPDSQTRSGVAFR